MLFSAVRVSERRHGEARDVRVPCPPQVHHLKLYQEANLRLLVSYFFDQSF